MARRAPRAHRLSSMIFGITLTKPAFTAKIDVEFADDAEPSLAEDGAGASAKFRTRVVRLR